MARTQIVVNDPCPPGPPGILTVAHVAFGGFSDEVSGCLVACFTGYFHVGESERWTRTRAFFITYLHYPEGPST